MRHWVKCFARVDLSRMLYVHASMGDACIVMRSFGTTALGYAVFGCGYG